MISKVSEIRDALRLEATCALNSINTLICVFAAIWMLPCISLRAQAPVSIAGKTFGVEITSGDGLVFANSGFYLFAPANSGTGYQVFNDDGTTESGTYAGYAASGSTASLTLSDNAYPGLPIDGNFSFLTPASGLNSLTASVSGYSAYQNGDFLMFTNPVPASIAGHDLIVNVQQGGGVFASGGDFAFAAATSGNAYKIISLSAGGTNSSGTYAYSRPNLTCGSLNLNDSVFGVGSTAYLVLTNAHAGGYYLTSANGYQAGYITVLNSTAPTSIAGDTFISHTSSGAYFLILPADSGDSYQVIGLGSAGSSDGTYAYLHTGAQAIINFSDSANGRVTGNYFYSSPQSGSYALSAGTSGQNTETGDFAMLTNPAPDSISGQGFYITVMNGAYPFSSSGSFTLSTAASGNNYVITPVTGNISSSTGTYSYSKINSSCGQMKLNDPITGASESYITFTNSIEGGYMATQPSSGGFQLGLITALKTAIAIASPTADSHYTTASGSINLSGTANDTLGISRVTWTNSRGGSGTANGTAAWNVSGIALQSGTNVITVMAHDPVGNSAQAVLSISYNPPDTTPPSISITSPTTAGSFATNGPSLDLAGTASDNVGVTQVTWSNNRGGSGIAAGTTGWSVSGITLHAGTNIITVTAHDSAGNIGQTDLMAVYTTAPPLINIASPTTARNFTNYSHSINLSGTASDEVGVTMVTWTNNRGGNGIAAGTTAWSITGIPLQNGTNLISVMAHDAAGNQKEAAISVFETVPMLRFRPVGNKIVLLWPTNAGGFQLQESASLETTSVWKSASSPFIMNNQYVVTNSDTMGFMFYRLKK